MRMSRKAFLRAIGSAAVLTTGTPAGAAAAAARTNSAKKPMSNDLSAAMFRPHIGTRFRVTDPHGAVTELELAQVSEVTCDACLEQFTLVFHGPGSRQPLDGLHHFEHAALAPLTLFITPAAGSNAQRVAYQACFSRVREPGQGAP
jgi:hypothetical protein